MKTLDQWKKDCKAVGFQVKAAEEPHRGTVWQAFHGGRVVEEFLPVSPWHTGNQPGLAQTAPGTAPEKAKQQYDNPSIGCYVDECAGSADDCNRRTIQFAQGYGFKPGRGVWLLGSEGLSWVGDKAVEFLNDLETRSFMYWGFEDNSLFLMANVEGASEDVGFKSTKDQDYPPDDYRGEWLHVSDHGNATLYVRGDDGKDTEIWSVV